MNHARLLVASFALLAGCPRPADPVEPAAPPPTSPTPAQRPDPQIEALNLDFEVAKGSEPEGWALNGKGYAMTLDSQAKAGDASLKFEFVEASPNGFGVAVSAYPLDRAKGKRVTLRGYIKTQDVTEGYAGLWMRVDGPDGQMISLDNMGDRGVEGTADWTQVEVVADVPPEAVNVAFGALLTGHGAAWVDALSFELGPMPVLPSEVTVAGTVAGAGGDPVPGAFIAVLPPVFGSPVATGRTAADGSFSFTVPPGTYRLSVSAPGLLAQVFSPMEYDGDDQPRRVSLVAGGVKIEGRVLDETGAAVGDTEVWMNSRTVFFGPPLYTRSGEDGRYSINVPADLDLMVLIRSEQVLGEPAEVRSDGDKVFDLEVVRRLPAPDAIVEQIGKRSVALSGVAAGAGFSDMEPLRKMIGKARIVGLGEATHGTREFFQMKHRMLEFLVERMGFTVFAIEATFTGTNVVNDYVLHGKGSAVEGLDAMLFWTWHTEEVRDLIEWMRAYNADPSHKTKLEFIGFDMQAEEPAAKIVADYLAEVDPELKEVAAKIEASPRTIIERFDERRRDYVAKSSPKRFDLARQHAVVYGQWKAMREAEGGDSFNVRDESMAQNVGWILDTKPRGTKVVVWAHNGHVGRELMLFRTMGNHLHERYRDDYRIVGFAFGDGSFQAMGASGQGLQSFEVGAPPAESVDAAFRRAGCSVCVLDMRRLPRRSPLRTWLSQPRISRDIGAVFADEQDMEQTVRMRDVYDLLIYVDRTTRARPVAAKR